jgi:cytochrome c5
MTVITKLLFLAFFVVAALSFPLHGATQPVLHGRTSPQGFKKYEKPAKATHEDEGDRIFKQNCSRCHSAPEGFSSRISGTIVLHMRVKANLSKHDQDELMRFFNP